MTFLILLIEFNKYIVNKVESILNKSKIWKDYKDQKHDLFISNTTAIGYLTNSVPSVAGKLLSSIKILLFYNPLIKLCIQLKNIGYLTAGTPGTTTIEKAPPSTDILDDSNNLFK